ncbi:MAG: Uma2 family endonuclease, partial [Cyanobacteria bacterium J06628_3]
LEFQGFHLVDGEYQPLKPSEQGWLWSEQLGLFLGIENGQLRYFTSEGEILPTPEELAKRETQRANQETQRADQEAQRADQEAQKAERLAAKLRELNIDVDDL